MKQILIAIAILSTSCSAGKSTDSSKTTQVKTVEITTPQQPDIDIPEGTSVAYFASGCFWCVEAIFESVRGVSEAVSGYAGGTAKTANYSDVSSGASDHAEAVMVYYDSTVVSYNTLLQVFFGSHDPTTLNQQGPDRGTQYRSTIFYQNERELSAATAYIADLESQKVFAKPITTTLEPLTKFYAAEDYHQDYEARNPNQPYVRSVSVPRLRRFQKKYPDLLKPTDH